MGIPQFGKLLLSFRWRVQGRFVVSILVVSLLFIPILVICELQSSVHIPTNGSINYPTKGYYKGAIVFAKYIAPTHPDYIPWSLDIAVDLGINTFRIRELHKVTLAQLESALSAINSVGIKAIPVLPLFPYYPYNLSEAKVTAYRYIVDGGFVGDPRILMWDIINEPMNIDDPVALNWLKEVLAYVKSLDPSKPVTFGGWHSVANGWNSPADIPLFIDNVDVVSPHYFIGAYYKTYERYRQFLTDVLNFSKGKPVILQAWGYNTVDPPTTADEINQTTYYEGVFKALGEVDIQGTAFWTFLPPYPPEPASIVYSNGSYRPAAYVVKDAYALP